MIGRIVLVASMLIAPGLLTPAWAQDVPGIEICTVEKTMERRTSCLQSNVNFLQQSLTKQALASQQKLDAATAQIQALRESVVGLQKEVERLEAKYNNGKPFPPVGARELPQGRPMGE